MASEQVSVKTPQPPLTIILAMSTISIPTKAAFESIQLGDSSSRCTHKIEDKNLNPLISLLVCVGMLFFVVVVELLIYKP